MMANRQLYIITLINLLMTCSEERNSYTENICQILIPYKVVDELLFSKPKNFCFKLEIIKFLFHVHIDSQKILFYHKLEIILNALLFLSEEFLLYSHFQEEGHELHSKANLKVMSFSGVITYREMFKEYIMVLSDLFFIVLSRTKKETSILFKDSYDKIIRSLIKGGMFYMDHSPDENYKLFNLLNFCIKFTDPDLAKEVKESVSERHSQLELFYLKRRSGDKSMERVKRKKSKMLRIGVTRGNMKIPNSSKSNIKTIITQENQKTHNRKVRVLRENGKEKELSKTDFLQLWLQKYFTSEEYVALCEDEFQ